QQDHLAAAVDMITDGDLVGGECVACGAPYICVSAGRDAICPRCAMAKLSGSGLSVSLALSMVANRIGAVRERLGRSAPKGVRPELRSIQREIERLAGALQEEAGDGQ